MIAVEPEALRPGERSELESHVRDYFAKRVGCDFGGSWENRPSAGEIVCFAGAVNLIEHLTWEGYEYGFRRLESFRQLLCLSTVALAKLLQRPTGIVPLDGSRRLAILAEDLIGRPYPILLDAFLVTLLANSTDEQFDPIYVEVLTRTRVDWGPGTFPALRHAMWMPTYFGVEIPSDIREKWLAANRRADGPDGGGVAVARGLGLRAPRAIVESNWEDLASMLDSVHGEPVE